MIVHYVPAYVKTVCGKIIVKPTCKTRNLHKITCQACKDIIVEAYNIGYTAEGWIPNSHGDYNYKGE